jgi:hypothetical protein
VCRNRWPNAAALGRGRGAQRLSLAIWAHADTAMLSSLVPNKQECTSDIFLDFPSPTPSPTCIITW